MKKNVFIKILSNKWFVLLFNTAFFVIMAWLLPIHFEENDDATMCMIANGHYSGTPDGHLVFINAIYGWVIAGLYMVADIVEWYTLSFCVLHILAMSVIMYILLNKMKIAIWLKLVFIAFAYIYILDKNNYSFSVYNHNRVVMFQRLFGTVTISSKHKLFQQWDKL